MQVSIREQVTGIMSHLCTCTRHGYTQGAGRMGGSEKETININGLIWEIGAGDYDCSGSIISVWDLVLQRFYGFETENCTYTGNMRAGFTNTGVFEWHPMSSGFVAQPGDIYLNEAHHTAMCITSTPDILGEFLINEKGTITGGQPGDQTGNESRLHAYYNFPWNGILHYTGKEVFKIESEEDMTPAEVWEYNYEDGAPGGNTYNTLLDIHALVSVLASTDASIAEAETGEHVNTGANMPLRLAYMEAYLKQINRKLDKVFEELDLKC